MSATGNLLRKGRLPRSFSVDMCDVCANLVVNGKRTVDIGRCAGCANYFCDCWLESARFENDPDIYLFCNSDALGGCYVEEDEESTEASP